ncbi:MAG: exo-alpha-sialidase [Bacteroidetes bacterium]|nr:exo-alpha-sialidase [Bacteroidota bacterium]
MKLSLIFIFITNVGFSQFANILISSQLEAKGVSIAINPKNTKQMIAGAGMANAYFSEDSGLSWKKNGSICEAYNLFGEPMVFWDTAQKAFFTDLAYLNPNVLTDGSWVDRVILNKSDDFGKTYSNCEDFGKNEKKVQYRHFVNVDPKTNVFHATWTQFNKFESNLIKDSSIIRYSKSTDGGKRWSDPKKISLLPGNCSNSDSTLMGAVPCVGPDGDVYVAWAGAQGIVFQKSWNDGATWLPKEKIIVPQKNGWDYKVNGTHKANGLPFTFCDLSKSAHRGRIYISWSDEKNGEKNKDVFLIYSDDKGENWSEPILVTYHPNHKEQFMPCMTIDQSNGYLYILYYDQKNYFENGLTDVYLALSKNGGQKFDYYKINNKPFKPNKDETFGNYLGISVVNSTVRPIWMQRDKKKELNVYTAIIDEKSLQNYTEGENEIELEKTFNFSEEINIKFNAKKDVEITAVITKPLEAGFEKVIIKNKKFKTGKNTLQIKTKDLELLKDSYIVTLYYNNKSSFTWIIKE